MTNHKRRVGRTDGRRETGMYDDFNPNYRPRAIENGFTLDGEDCEGCGGLIRDHKYDAIEDAYGNLWHGDCAGVAGFVRHLESTDRRERAACG